MIAEVRIRVKDFLLGIYNKKICVKKRDKLAAKSLKLR
jgi:hypothetical protein